MNANKSNKGKNGLITLCLLALPVISVAQENEVATTTYFSNALFNTLLATIIILAILVTALSSALKNIASSEMFVDALRKNKEKKDNANIKNVIILFCFMLAGYSATAQDKIMPVADDGRIGGLDQFTFYFMLTIIFLELLVTGILIYTIKSILRTDQPSANTTIAKPKEKTILDKLSDAVEVENEEAILLDHDYDGIRELDNNLPPWWKYGFYLTIIVAVLYLINYHVTKTSPLQAEEYALSMKKADEEIAEYMKNSANNVDENTVKTLTDPADIASGKELFLGVCATCHGKLGEGAVGPNLTDDYWLHSGGIKDIFKTIKYGWPDKGMKSWKDDYSPIQIAQLASFIKSLRGTNPPKQKEKQGELYIEAGAVPADSNAVKQDSLKITAIADSLKK